MATQKTISEIDLINNCYYYFIETLAVLIKSPEEQCRIMKNYNVAYELKTDALSVDCLLNQNIIEFTEEQKKFMLDLSKRLHDLPEQVLIGSDKEAENLNSMNNPCWNDIKEASINLLALLKAVTEQNHRYFQVK